MELYRKKNNICNLSKLQVISKNQRINYQGENMNIEERIVKEKISTDKDLMLCVDNIVFALSELDDCFEQETVNLDNEVEYRIKKS